MHAVVTAQVVCVQGTQTFLYDGVIQACRPLTQIWCDTGMTCLVVFDGFFTATFSNLQNQASKHSDCGGVTTTAADDIVENLNLNV